MVKNASAIATLVAVLVVIILPVAQEIKLILFLVIFFVFIYVKRGYIYVAIASRTLNKKDADEAKAWRMFKRGWEAGLAPNYNLMLANLWIQRSDIETAALILDSIVERESHKKKPNVQVVAGAKISKSMAHWAMNERDKAIEILQTLRAEKTVDKNLYINLSSFLLERGDVEEARAVIEESASALPESPGMLDNRGWLLLLTGKLEEARRLYHSLIADSKPRFPEAYVHAAMVEEQLGAYAKAREYYHEALDKTFYRTTGYSKEMIQERLDAISLLSDELKPSESGQNTNISYFESHDYDDEDLFDDDELPNTELDDDDDLDPNIELDDDDYYRDNDPEVDESEIDTEEDLLYGDDDEEEDAKKES